MPSATRPKNVAKAYVYPGFLGFRYTFRDSEGKVIHESPRHFKSRRAAREDILKHWPNCDVSFEVI